MYTGEPIFGRDFYILLSESVEFTSELGKMTLASGMLEAEIIKYFRRNGITDDLKIALLGKLIDLGEKKNLFDKNTLISLKQSKKQRNDFIHKLYSLLMNITDEGLLPIDNLIDTDVEVYVDYAWQLRTNLENLATNVARR